MENQLLLESPTKSEKQPPLEPYKEKVFRTYCLWKSLPAFFKFPPKDKKSGNAPTATEYSQMMGIEDEEVLELVELKTQREFSEKFNVSMDTLTDWNKTVKLRSSLEEIKQWARGLSKNVVMGLYNATIRGGLPQHYQTWFKVIEDFVEKTEIEHGYKGVTKISYDIVETIENGDTTENQQEATSSPANPQG